MKRREFIAGLGAISVLSPNMAFTQLLSKLPEEGLSLKYKVFFGGNEIGHQNVLLKAHTDKEHFTISHHIKLEVRILFALAYALDHSSTEVWSKEHQLKSIKSSTKENDKSTLVDGALSSKGFKINGEYGSLDAPRSVVTSDSFWLLSALNADSVVNARTGEIAKPKVKKISDGHYHLSADFSHGGIIANMYFSGNYLEKAEIDSEGHIVTFERIN